jgi:hypothetical protein
LLAAVPATVPYVLLLSPDESNDTRVGDAHKLGETKGPMSTVCGNMSTIQEYELVESGILMIYRAPSRQKNLPIHLNWIWAIFFSHS